MPFGNRKKYFPGSFQFSIVTIKNKYHPSGNMKSRGNIFLEIGTPDIRVSMILVGYRRYNKRISR